MSRPSAEPTIESVLTDLVERVTRLERRRSVTVGSWRIVDRDGVLTAVNAETGATYTLAP